MPVVAVAELMRRAMRERYAVGYFESWNLESVQGVVDAAEQAGCPVILGFNGDFLTGLRREAHERLALYAALARSAAESARVPCAVFFNECVEDERTLWAVTAGFNLVMPATGTSSPEEYVQRVRAICAHAHEHGVAVQAELGELPCGLSGAADGGAVTDPEEAARFVEATGVDLLAVSVGNVHVLVEGRRGLDLKRLARVRQAVDVPLVLHGGTGVHRDDLRAAVRQGIALVQYGTCLKQAYLAAVRRALDTAERNPHTLLGIGGPADVLCAGRAAVRDAVLAEFDALGCRGKG